MAGGSVRMPPPPPCEAAEPARGWRSPGGGAPDPSPPPPPVQLRQKLRELPALLRSGLTLRRKSAAAAGHRVSCRGRMEGGMQGEREGCREPAGCAPAAACPPGLAVGPGAVPCPWGPGGDVGMRRGSPAGGCGGSPGGGGGPLPINQIAPGAAPRRRARPSFPSRPGRTRVGRARVGASGPRSWPRALEARGGSGPPLAVSGVVGLGILGVGSLGLGKADGAVLPGCKTSPLVLGDVLGGTGVKSPQNLHKPGLNPTVW